MVEVAAVVAIVVVAAVAVVSIFAVTTFVRWWKSSVRQCDTGLVWVSAGYPRLILVGCPWVSVGIRGYPRWPWPNLRKQAVAIIYNIP